MAIKPMSELSAVNLILRNMSESPVNTLTGNLPLEAAMALETLNEVSLSLQKEGWYFNTEYHRLQPDHAQEIRLPVNTLRIKPSRFSHGLKLTVRSGKLFDIAPFRNTFKFAGPVDLALILGLPFSDLPASAQNYVSLSAARILAAREVGDESSLSEDTNDETRAWVELQSEQIRAEPVSLASSSVVRDVLSERPY